MVRYYRIILVEPEREMRAKLFQGQNRLPEMGRQILPSKNLKRFGKPHHASAKLGSGTSENTNFLRRFCWARSAWSCRDLCPRGFTRRRTTQETLLVTQSFQSSRSATDDTVKVWLSKSLRGTESLPPQTQNALATACSEHSLRFAPLPAFVVPLRPSSFAAEKWPKRWKQQQPVTWR